MKPRRVSWNATISRPMDESIAASGSGHSPSQHQRFRERETRRQNHDGGRLKRLRGHDLRHNRITEHAEMGTAQSAREAKAGQTTQARLGAGARKPARRAETSATGLDARASGRLVPWPSAGLVGTERGGPCVSSPPVHPSVPRSRRQRRTAASHWSRHPGAVSSAG